MLLSQHPGSRVVYWWGNLPTILISKAEDARRILSADVNYMLKFSFITRGFHKLLGSGLLLANGKDWQLQCNVLRPAFFAEKLKYLPTDLNCKIWALDRRNNKELCEIIEQRKRTVAVAKSTESGSSCSYGTDLLGLILDAVEEEAKLGRKGAQLSTQQVIDDCKTTFFAGHETTANLLAWTLVLLSLDQEWQEKARQEVWEVCGKQGEPDADKLNQLKIVGMILHESLRLYPPVLEHGRRELSENVRMDDGTVLPRGAGVTYTEIRRYGVKMPTSSDPTGLQKGCPRHPKIPMPSCPLASVLARALAKILLLWRLKSFSLSSFKVSTSVSLRDIAMPALLPSP